MMMHLGHCLLSNSVNKQSLIAAGVLEEEILTILAAFGKIFTSSQLHFLKYIAAYQHDTKYPHGR